MSDDLKQKAKAIIAEEAASIGPVGGTWVSSTEVFAAFNRSINRLNQLLEPEPPKGREERVKQVELFVAGYMRDSALSYCTQLAEQIVATEPKPMSREKMVKVVTAFARQEKLTSLANDLETGCLGTLACGALTAIDALAGKTPATDEKPKAKPLLITSRKGNQAMSSEETNEVVETVEAAEVPENIRLAEIGCQGAEAELVAAKEAHAEAKREYDRQVLHLRALCREQDKEYPLLDAAVRKVTEWRSAPLLNLNLSAKVEKPILDFGLTTLGALQEHMNDQGGFWAKQIKGLGEKGAEEVSGAFVRFWADHPEFCEAEIVHAEEPKEA